MNALVPKAPERMPLAYAEIERLAVSIAKSGLFGMKTPDQAMALMMIAHAEGRHPALAARDYDVIQGRPAKKAEAMLRDFLEAGGKVEWHAVTDEKADATFTHPQTGSVRIDWDTKRATVAGLTGKDNYKKFPRQMLRSRVVSEGVRTLWPLATSGLYVPEETADFAGTTLEHTDEPEPDERDALNDAIPMTKQVPLNKAAAAGMQRAPRVAEKTEAPQRKSWAQWAETLEIADRDTQDTAAIGRLIARAEVAEIVRLAQQGEPTPAKSRIMAAARNLEERYLADPPQPPDEPEAEELPELEIVNGDKLAAG